MIEVSGDRLAAERLERVGRRALHQRDAMRVAARETQRHIAGIPVATGRLKKGTTGGSESTVTVTDRGFVLGTDVPYAHFVFYGTRTMHARPPDVPDVAERTARLIASDLGAG